MGSASRIALEHAKSVLNTLSKGSKVGEELLEASQQLNSSSALRASIADASVSQEQKTKLIERVFAPASADTKSVLQAVANGRWSNEGEMVAGIEELGIRGEVLESPELADELLGIEKVISSDHELELTLGSKLGDSGAKAALADKIFAGKVSAGALGVLKHTVANASGRRIGKTLQQFASIAANQGGRVLATVTVAKPLDEARLSQLQKTLTEKQGSPVQITTVVDPEVIGGMRIRIADEVIDATVKSRLDQLRLQLSR